jgi:hypothetical protein
VMTTISVASMLAKEERRSLIREVLLLKALGRPAVQFGSLLDFLSLSYVLSQPAMTLQPRTISLSRKWQRQVSAVMSEVQEVYENVQFELFNRLTAVDKSLAVQPQPALWCSIPKSATSSTGAL